MTFNSKLIKKEAVAQETMAFYFEKPNDFKFKAGQTMDVTIENPPQTDAEGNSRTFCIASAPYENTLMIATRMRDTAFKRVLKHAPLDLAVQIEGPFGSMVLHNDIEKPAVFLAGGIGITPFFAMIKEATYQKLPHKIFLFYSNRKREDAAFLSQLIELEKQNPNFKLITIMTQSQGHITPQLLSNYIPDLKIPAFYLAGPPNMVAAMRAMLKTATVSSDNVRFEEFAGY